MPALTYTLTIDGSPAAADLLEAIQQIEIEEHASLAAMLRLRVATDVNDAGTAWSVIDDDLFTRLTPISCSVAVGSGPAGFRFEGRVIETRATLASTPGSSTLEVVAMDGMVLMNLEAKRRAWPNMADSDIASQIFAEYGFTPDVDSTQPTREQDAITTMQCCTDLQFLQDLAARNGFDCYLDTDSITRQTTGHFHALRLQSMPQGTLTVNMGAATNVESLSVQLDAMRPGEAQAAGVQVNSVGAQNASVAQASQTLLGRTSLLGGSPAARRIYSNSGLAETGELQTYVQAAADRSAWALTAQGVLDTLAYGAVLRARQTVLVRGAGTNYSGTYLVESVQHLIAGESYTQHFNLVRNALGLQGNEAFGAV